MANRKSPVRVIRRGDKWAVIREGNKKASSLHDTKEQAEKRGRSLAHKSGAEFFLHDEQGRVRERESHGLDPF